MEHFSYFSSKIVQGSCTPSGESELRFIFMSTTPTLSPRKASALHLPSILTYLPFTHSQHTQDDAAGRWAEVSAFLPLRATLCQCLPLLPRNRAWLPTSGPYALHRRSGGQIGARQQQWRQGQQQGDYLTAVSKEMSNKLRHEPPDGRSPGARPAIAAFLPVRSLDRH